MIRISLGLMALGPIVAVASNVLAAGLVTFGPIFALSANPHPTSTVVPGAGGISIGALLGLLATWVGVVVGYVNLRRLLRHDMMIEMQRVAREVADERITNRAKTFMDRGLQEEINRKNDDRYTSLANMRELTAEIRLLMSEIRRRADQIAGQDDRRDRIK